MKIMIILALLVLFGAVTGILNEWVVVIIGIISLPALYIYSMLTYQPDFR